MKPPTFAPVYAAFFPMLAEIAQAKGYALAVHGSLHADLDIVAVPWTEEAVTTEKLLDAVAEYVTKTMSLMFESATLWHGPEEKPHGRRAWKLVIGNGATVDLSIMPLRTTNSGDGNEEERV